MLGVLRFSTIKKLPARLATAHARSLILIGFTYLALTSLFGPRWQLQSFFDDSSWLMAELQARGVGSLLSSSLNEERAVGLVLPLWIFQILVGDQPAHWMIAQLLLHVLCGFLLIRLLLRHGLDEAVAWLGGLAFCFSPALIDAYLWPISLQHQLVLLAGFVLVEQAEVADRLRRRGFFLNLLWMLPLRPSILIFAWGVLPLVLWGSGRKGLARWFTWLSALTLGQTLIALGFDGGWQLRSTMGTSPMAWAALSLFAVLGAVLFRSRLADSATQIARKLFQASALRIAAILLIFASSLLSQIGILQLAELAALANFGELAPPSIDFSRWQMIFAHPQASLLTPELSWSLIAFATATLVVFWAASPNPAAQSQSDASIHVARLWPWVLSVAAMSFYLSRLALDPQSAIPQTEPLGVPSRYLLFVTPLSLIIIAETLRIAARTGSSLIEGVVHGVLHGLIRGLSPKRDSQAARLGHWHRRVGLFIAFAIGLCLILPWGLEPLRSRARDTLLLDAFSSFPLEYALLSEDEVSNWPKADWSRRSDLQVFSARAVNETRRHWHQAQSTSDLPIFLQMMGQNHSEILQYPQRLGASDLGELLRRLYPLHRHAPEPTDHAGQQALRYQIQLQILQDFATQLHAASASCTEAASGSASDSASDSVSPSCAHLPSYLAALKSLTPPTDPDSERPSAQPESRPASPDKDLP
ncbi:MAG TPA: hypothetical protein PLZ57_03010 [Pseudobdellovibrionaceae bacterium]|nr:hypothetical protein [Pseudobdellovibrionaceae bacterium]